MALLKQSTAYTRMFLMVDSTDHITAKTGLTVTVTLSKAGAAFGAAGGTVTEVANGFYKIALTTTDTNTLGDLVVHCTGTAADATDFVDQVVLFDLGVATQKVDVDTIKTQTVTCAAGVTVLASVGTAATSTAQTGDTFARVGAPVGASISADVAAVKTDTAAVKTKTDFLPSATAGAAGGVFIAGSNAATTVNITGNLTGNVSGSVGSVTGAVGSVTAAVSVTGDLSATMKTSVSAAVWDEARASHTTAATFGQGVASVQGSVTGSVASVTGAVGSVTGNVGGNVVGSVASVTGNVGGNVTGSVGSVAAGGIDSTALTSATYNAVADGVLDRNMATGTDSGSDSTTTRTPRQALRILRNKASIAAGTLTVTKENDTTASWTAAISTTAGNPISAVDPT